MRKVAVLFGGKSCENEISVLTGVFVLNLIDREKFIPVPVYIHTDGGMYTSPKMTDLNIFKKRDFSSFERIFFDGGTMYAFNGAKTKAKNKGKIDAALNCCHGGLGEGGGVSALMQMNEIPLASPELTASGMFMDKTLTKLVAKALNIPAVEYIRVGETDYARRGKFLLKNIETRLKYPVVVKPAHLGSSIGISVAETEAEAKAAVDAAFLLDDRVIIERFLKNKRDINCAAYSLGGKFLSPSPRKPPAEKKFILLQINISKLILASRREIRRKRQTQRQPSFRTEIFRVGNRRGCLRRFPTKRERKFVLIPAHCIRE